SGTQMVDVRSGSLARVAMMSAANPLVFGRSFDEKKRGYLDPGVDRRAATVIEDACRWFPDSRLIAINVTGKPAQYDSQLPCEVVEVQVATTGAPPADVFELGAAFDELWSA